MADHSAIQSVSEPKILGLCDLADYDALFRLSSSRWCRCTHRFPEGHRSLRDSLLSHQT